MSGNDNNPFRWWVKKPLGVLTFVFMFFPLMLAGGTYLTNVSEMVGVTALWMEDFQMVSSCAFIGMAVFFPFMVRYLLVRDVKLMYVVGFSLLMVLNILLAHVENVVGLCVCCFLLGFVRVMLVLNTTFTIAPYAAGINTIEMFTTTAVPDKATEEKMTHMRNLTMPVLYLLIMFIVEVGNYIMAGIAYHYTWRHCYMLSNIVLGIGLLLVLLTMRFGKLKGEHFHIPWHTLGEFVLAITFLVAFCYTLIYGKTLDWFSSTRIWTSFCLTLLSLGTLIVVGTLKKTPYLDFHVFLYKNVWFGIALFTFTVLCNYGNTLIVSFIKIATPANGVHVGAQSLWCTVGVFVGLAISIVMIVRHVRFKFMFALGFALMSIANIYLYFEFQPQGAYERMVLPTIVNFAGMIIPYVVVCAYGMYHLRSWMLPTWLFLMLAVRNVAAPAINMAFYSNEMQCEQQYFATRFVADAPLLSDAPKVQQGVALMSLKSVAGGIIWLSGLSAIVIVACPRRWSLKS